MSITVTTTAHSPVGRRFTSSASFISDNRTRVLTVTIVAGLAAGLLLSPHAWFGARLYPTTPILRSLGSLPRPLDLCLYIALLGALAGTALAGRPRRWIAAALVMAGIFVCFDQSRLQPWLYQYLIMLAALAAYEPRTEGDNGRAALEVCRLVMVCIYFWSGAQKLSAEFISRTFPWLIAPITRLLPHSVGWFASSLGLVAPLTEIAIAVGLLTRRFRNSAIAAALGMHAVLLFCLGPFGWDYNSIVWPWNIAMGVCVVVLFWRAPESTAVTIVWPGRRRFHALIVLLLGVAPVFTFFNLWDQYLSFGLYARSRNRMALYVTTDLAYRLPSDIEKHVYVTDSAGVYGIDVPRWSLAELNVTIYPEPRVYKAVGRFICSFAQHTSGMRLVIRQERVLFSPDRQVEYDCPALMR